MQKACQQALADVFQGKPLLSARTCAAANDLLRQ
jgi:hypothetical protein